MCGNFPLIVANIIFALSIIKLFVLIKTCFRIISFLVFIMHLNAKQMQKFRTSFLTLPLVIFGSLFGFNFRSLVSPSSSA